MCTAVTYKTKDFYFGRTLDYEFSYGEEITVTPRNYIFDFRHIGQLKSHYAIICMAFVSEGYPLYYDAVNEKGLGMAGLNFVGNAAYKASVCGEKDIALIEFKPWILSQCATVSEARAKLDGINLTGTPFSSQLPAAQLHWIIADKDETTMEEILELIKGPDFPTGGEILGTRGIEEAYRTGRGKIRVRAVTNIETMPNGKSRIIVTELPYMVNKARLIEKIAELVRDKKVDGITDLSDQSSREGMRIVIELRKDVQPEVILNQLFKLTALQTTFGVNSIA